MRMYSVQLLTLGPPAQHAEGSPPQIFDACVAYDPSVDFAQRIDAPAHARVYRRHIAHDDLNVCFEQILCQFA